MSYFGSAPLAKSTVQIGPYSWNVQTADTLYDLTVIDNNYRFEVRNGDSCTWIGDAPTQNRSELACNQKVTRGQLLSMKFDHLLEVGPISDRWGIIFAQIHGTDVAGQAAHPCLALNIYKENNVELLHIELSTADTSKQPSVMAPVITLAKLAYARGKMHKVAIEYVDDAGDNNGRVKVVIDGTTIVDYKGQTGYAFAAAAGSGLAYSKFGIYTGPATQTNDYGLVSHVQNPEFIVN